MLRFALLSAFSLWFYTRIGVSDYLDMVGVTGSIPVAPTIQSSQTGETVLARKGAVSAASFRGATRSVSVETSGRESARHIFWFQSEGFKLQALLRRAVVVELYLVAIPQQNDRSVWAKTSNVDHGISTSNNATYCCEP